MDVPATTSSLLIACGLCLLNTASPGPSNMMISATAATAGRVPAIAMSCGVIIASCCWGLLAAMGVASVVAGTPAAMALLQLLCGLYLLWLGLKSANRAWARDVTRAAMPVAAFSKRRMLWRGLAMHILNPKCIFMWLAVAAVGLPAGGSTSQALTVVAACIAVSTAVLMVYAILFSSVAAQRVYQATRRPFDTGVAIIFAVAGGHMIAFWCRSHGA